MYAVSCTRGACSSRSEAAGERAAAQGRRERLAQHLSQPGGRVPSPSAGHRWTCKPHCLQPPCSQPLYLQTLDAQCHQLQTPCLQTPTTLRPPACKPCCPQTPACKLRCPQPPLPTAPTADSTHCPQLPLPTVPHCPQLPPSSDLTAHSTHFPQHPLPTEPTARRTHCPQNPPPTEPTTRRHSLSEQMTPAAKRVPVFLQLRLLPWCWQWLRDISWPAHFTPLSTISVTLLASQYQVSWGAGEQAGWRGWLPWVPPHRTAAQPCPRAQAAQTVPSLGTN